MLLKCSLVAGQLCQGALFTEFNQSINQSINQSTHLFEYNSHSGCYIQHIYLNITATVAAMASRGIYI